MAGRRQEKNKKMFNFPDDSRYFKDQGLTSSTVPWPCRYTLETVFGTPQQSKFLSFGLAIQKMHAALPEDVRLTVGPCSFEQ